MNKIFFLLFTLFFIVPSFAQAILEGKVEKVSDGDTFTIRDNWSGNKFRVRFYGIDAPEKKQGFGKKARQFVSEWVSDKVVQVWIRDTDRYGRIVGEIYVNGKLLNIALLREGLAWWYQKYAPDNLQYAQAEKEAKASKKGLWQNPASIPPWQYRSEQKQK
jgi:micrococcal nuclease